MTHHQLITNSVRSSFRAIITAISFTLIIPGCASLPTDYEKIPSHVIQDTEDNILAQKAAPRVAEHPGQSGFHLLPSGMDAFLARIGLMERAQRTLDIQYYIWHADTSGILLVDRLLSAADRGVRVRLLLDDLNTAG
jgi:putative cardiolipin synthase